MGGSRLRELRESAAAASELYSFRRSRRHRNGEFTPKPLDRTVADRSDDELSAYIRQEMQQLRRVVSDLAYLIESRTTEVDEKAYAQLTAQLTQFSTQAEYQSEIIETIVVTGPPNSAFTLQLGSAARVWNLNTGPNGFCNLINLKIRLDELDQRQLTSAVVGNWTLELMGRQNPRLRFSREIDE